MVGQNMLRTSAGNQVVMKNDFEFEAPVDVNNYLKQIKLPHSLHAYSMHSELPSYIGIMGLA